MTLFFGENRWDSDQTGQLINMFHTTKRMHVVFQSSHALLSKSNSGNIQYLVFFFALLIAQWMSNSKIQTLAIIHGWPAPEL